MMQVGKPQGIQFFQTIKIRGNVTVAETAPTRIFSSALFSQLLSLIQKSDL
jgi:hypothetical protein